VATRRQEGVVPAPLLLVALVAVLAPWPAAILLPLLCARRGLGGAGLCGLILLALASQLQALNRPRTAPIPDERTAQAWRALRLTGRWRTPPAAPARLMTAAGPVALRLASDLPPPAPGARLEVLARVDPAGRATAVAFQADAELRGAWPERVAQAAAWRARTLAPGDAGGLLRSLLLGDRSRLDGATKAAFVATGTSHLLALSGLHVSLLAALAGRVLGPSLAAGWLLIFTWVAGPRAPLLRALCGRALAWACGRDGRPVAPLPNLVLVALLLAVLAGPERLRSLSAQLSFLAVGGLIGGARITSFTPAAALLGPAGAVLAIAPLCAETFGQVQPLGILLTPLLTPLVALILALGSVSVLPGELCSCLDPLLRPALVGCSEALLELVHAAAALAPAPLRPIAPPVDPFLMGLAVVWALSVLARDRRSRLAAAA